MCIIHWLRPDCKKGKWIILCQNTTIFRIWTISSIVVCGDWYIGAVTMTAETVWHWTMAGTHQSAHNRLPIHFVVNGFGRLYCR